MSVPVLAPSVPVPAWKMKDDGEASSQLHPPQSTGSFSDCRGHFPFPVPLPFPFPFRLGSSAPHFSSLLLDPSAVRSQAACLLGGGCMWPSWTEGEIHAGKLARRS